MALLLVFAFIAGAGTAASPCVLPVLPAVLSASATGGRRRPLGIGLGLTVGAASGRVVAIALAYRLVSLPRTGDHDLSLRFQPGVSAYAFTFG